MGDWGAEAEPSDNLYVANLPPNVTDDLLPQIFGDTFKQGRVLTSKTPGEGTCVAVCRFISLEAAKQVRETMDGAVIEIAPHSMAIKIRYNGKPAGKGGSWDGGKGGGDSWGGGNWGKASAKGNGNAGPYNGGGGGEKQMDNLYVQGLPAGVDEAFMTELFTPYGTVAQVRIMPSKDGVSAHALVRMGSEAEAEQVKQLGGSFIEGHDQPLKIDNVWKKDNSGKGKDGGKGGGWGGDGGGWGGDGGGNDTWAVAQQIAAAIMGKGGDGGKDIGSLLGKLAGKGGGDGGGWGGGKGDGGFGGGKDGGKGGFKSSGKFQVDESGGVLGEFLGTIKSFSDKNGYGFIECPELAAHGDVFLHGDMKKNYQRGQKVKFTAVLTKNGKPQAKDLKSGLY